MTRILMNFVLILTIIFYELEATHSRTTHNSIRNSRSSSNAPQSIGLIQLTDLRRPIIIEQSKIEHDNCEPTCEDFNATENEAPENYAGVSGLKCHGWLDNCRHFASQNDEDDPATYCYTEKEKHLIWAKEESITNFKNSTEECIEESISLALKNIKNSECKVCLCMCTEESNDPESITNWAFSLLPQESDIDDDRIVTGVRISTYGKLIYLQIEQSQINSDNRGDWKPFSPPKNLVPNKDYSLLEPNSRSLNLDVIYVPSDNVITGVRFTKNPTTSVGERNGALRMEVQGTKFDGTSGKLIKDERTWYNSDSTDPSSTDYERNRFEISMDNLTSSFRTNAHDRFYEPNTYIKFGPANRTNDNGQFTIPYLSKSNVQSEKNKILKGIGLFYKGTEGYVGFITPKIFYNNRLNKYVNGTDEINSTDKNNIRTESSKEEEEEEEEEDYSDANTTMNPKINKSVTESTAIKWPSSTEKTEEKEEITTKNYATEVFDKMVRKLTTFLNDSSNADTNEGEDDFIETTSAEATTEIDFKKENSPIEESMTESNVQDKSIKETMTIKSNPKTKVMRKDSTMKTTTESPITVKEETSQSTTVRPTTEKISMMNTRISGAAMEEDNKIDELNKPIISEETKNIIPKEGNSTRIQTEKANGIVSEKEQDNIILKHMKEESTAVVITTERNATTGSVKENKNMVKAEIQNNSNSATALKIQIMFNIITLLVIISLV